MLKGLGSLVRKFGIALYFFFEPLGFCEGSGRGQRCPICRIQQVYLAGGKAKASRLRQPQTADCMSGENIFQRARARPLQRSPPSEYRAGEKGASCNIWRHRLLATAALETDLRNRLGAYCTVATDSPAGVRSGMFAPLEGWQRVKFTDRRIAVRPSARGFIGPSLSERQEDRSGAGQSQHPQTCIVVRGFSSR